MSGGSSERDEHTPWCCDGFAAFCALCRNRPASTLRCPGHAYSDRNRETVRTSRLHANFQHPDYEYRTTEGPRKQWDIIDLPPCDETGTPEPGWERNIDAGRNGWERFDYTEESYWRRPKRVTERAITVACAVVHTDTEGNVIPCPGYPHAEQEQPAATPFEEVQATVEDLRYRIRRAREALADDEPVPNHDERLRQAEIRAAVAEHEAEAYRNQVQALIRSIQREHGVPEEELSEGDVVVVHHEQHLSEQQVRQIVRNEIDRAAREVRRRR